MNVVQSLKKKIVMVCVCVRSCLKFVFCYGMTVQGLSLCYLMTSGLCKDIRCHV